MADKIVFNYVEIDNAVNAIRGVAEKYVSASNAFQTAMKNATEGWEGASKDNFIDFIVGPIKKYTEIDIPDMIKGVATLLKSNADSMSEADAEVGKNMPDSL